jgi:2-polyprenyl-3-methyl-5-hydroxy-6-metoxy-1,4-benzoquinol methylase
MTLTQTASCVACGGSLAFFGTRDAYVYAKCSRCGTLQLSPFPTAEELERAYSEQYARSGHYGTDGAAIFESAGPFYRAVLEELRRASLPPGPILDVGCGWGGMCRLLRDNGYEYLGIDFECESLDYCRTLSLNVRPGTLTALSGHEGHYSAILLLGVFEHLHDHAGLLDQAGKLLKPGGVLLILIPTARLYTIVARLRQRLLATSELPELHAAFCPPWHTAIFSVAGARRLIEDHGFVVDRLVPSPSGKSKGVTRFIQILATLVSRVGSAVFGTGFPLVLAHIFLCRVKEPAFSGRPAVER